MGKKSVSKKRERLDDDEEEENSIDPGERVNSRFNLSYMIASSLRQSSLKKMGLKSDLLTLH